MSSVRASSMRSRSLESMTKMRPWVPAALLANMIQPPREYDAGFLRTVRVVGSASGARASSPTQNNRVVATQHTREVVSPQGTDLVLAADVPDVELCVLVGDGLDVEADGGDGGDVLVELELVEDRCAAPCQQLS